MAALWMLVAIVLVAHHVAAAPAAQSDKVAKLEHVLSTLKHLESLKEGLDLISRRLDVKGPPKGSEDADSDESKDSEKSIDDVKDELDKDMGGEDEKKSDEKKPESKNNFGGFTCGTLASKSIKKVTHEHIQEAQVKISEIIENSGEFLKQARSFISQVNSFKEVEQGRQAHQKAIEAKAATNMVMAVMMKAYCAYNYLIRLQKVGGGGCHEMKDKIIAIVIKAKVEGKPLLDAVLNKEDDIMKSMKGDMDCLVKDTKDLSDSLPPLGEIKKDNIKHGLRRLFGLMAAMHRMYKDTAMVFGAARFFSCLEKNRDFCSCLPKEHSKGLCEAKKAEDLERGLRQMMGGKDEREVQVPQQDKKPGEGDGKDKQQGGKDDQEGGDDRRYGKGKGHRVPDDHKGGKGKGDGGMIPRLWLRLKLAVNNITNPELKDALQKIIMEIEKAHPRGSSEEDDMDDDIEDDMDKDEFHRGMGTRSLEKLKELVSKLAQKLTRK